MSYLDTRDLQKRLDELEEQREETLDPNTGEAIGLDEEEARELAELLELQSEIADWQYGETLIPEDEFEDYARQLAEDIGAIDSNAQWPLSYIDWEAAAEALAEDYTEVEYNGTTYLVRSC